MLNIEHLKIQILQTQKKLNSVMADWLPNTFRPSSYFTYLWSYYFSLRSCRVLLSTDAVCMGNDVRDLRLIVQVGIDTTAWKFGQKVVGIIL